ncbi:uncharacterized protein LOC121883116 isoform X2 [Thunnus maccoyii]|uniref:uncharacterized protein LOC121883116 isoform X2 n=1 Tax=Thunnus maccoyii TaxID=8240 RepID=UPI001C4AA8CD|nr:uncharacterized protein LOC121883116 isoform X2 [Thunnus maccoyii]
MNSNLKMAGLCWVTVMLAFFLSAENSLAAVNQNRLARIVNGILGEYRINEMFSLAVSIPENQNQDTDQILQQVFTSDPGDNVTNKIINDEMAGLHWVAVVLVFFLSTGNSLAAVDKSWLTSIVKGIKNEYALGDTFSLAVNVPQNQDPTNLQEVFQDDPADKVKQSVSQGQVYRGSRVVAASGAVLNVLENIQPLITSSQGNFLIVYSEESPCGLTCTSKNEGTVADKINDVIKNWSGYAFVFSKVVDVAAKDTSQRAESF